MIFYGLVDRRLAGTDLGEVFEFFPSRELAEEAMRAVIADEPDFQAVLDIVEVDLSGAPAQPNLHQRHIAHATGRAGDVFLCHPFLVHAADRHRGSEPRFMAQPPLFWAKPIDLDSPADLHSPVETAIRIGLGEV